MNGGVAMTVLLANPEIGIVLVLSANSFWGFFFNYFFYFGISSNKHCWSHRFIILTWFDERVNLLR